MGWWLRPTTAICPGLSNRCPRSSVRGPDLPADSETKTALAGQIAVLQNWDLRWGVDSVATSLAIFWGQEIAKAGQTAAS